MSLALSRRILGVIAIVIIGMLVYSTFWMKIGIVRSAMQYSSGILAINFIVVFRASAKGGQHKQGASQTRRQA
jgi:hypothetical protein